MNYRALYENGKNLLTQADIEDAAWDARLLLEHVCTDNLLKLCEQGDEDARSLARAAALSKARYPIDHVCTKAIKKYPLI